MVANENTSQKYGRRGIPINLGGYEKGISHGYEVIQTALNKAGIECPIVHDGNDTLIVNAEEPSQKSTIVKIIKEAMLKDLKLENGKQKSPLRSSLEEYSFFDRGGIYPFYPKKENND